MTLNFAHIAQAAELPESELRLIAAGPLFALSSIGTIQDGQVDGAGIAIRGGSVFDDALDGRFMACELAAARRMLNGVPGVQRVLIDAIESARVADRPCDRCA